MTEQERAPEIAQAGSRAFKTSPVSLTLNHGTKIRLADPRVSEHGHT